jgi:hypothetical protein
VRLDIVGLVAKLGQPLGLGDEGEAFDPAPQAEVGVKVQREGKTYLPERPRRAIQIRHVAEGRQAQASCCSRSMSMSATMCVGAMENRSVSCDQNPILVDHRLAIPSEVGHRFATSGRGVQICRHASRRMHTAQRVR